MSMKHLLAATALLALAACGQREALKPAAGHTLPQKPATAAVQPSVNALLDPGPETRPERSDDVLTRSQERPDDRFDLPPPG
jgi:predicted small lipoprotein YifL